MPLITLIFITLKVYAVDIMLRLNKPLSSIFLAHQMDTSTRAIYVSYRPAMVGWAVGTAHIYETKIADYTQNTAHILR